MLAQTLLSILTAAIAASARPSPQISAPACNSPGVLECCDSISANGTGIGCIISTLNLPTCPGSSSLACCSSSQSGVVNVNVQCIPVSVAV